MRATDGKIFAGLIATTANFALQGGLYQVSIVFANPSGLTAGLGQIGPDGSTVVAIGTPAVHTNSVATVQIPTGQYQVTISGSKGGSESVAFSVARVPND